MLAPHAGRRLAVSFVTEDDCAVAVIPFFDPVAERHQIFVGVDDRALNGAGRLLVVPTAIEGDPSPSELSASTYLQPR
jgi:hypothetical protein